MDDAVLQTGAILGHSHADNRHRDDENSGDRLNQVMTTFGAIPSSSKRRVRSKHRNGTKHESTTNMVLSVQFQQSVSLAQRVVKSQRESLEFQQKLKAALFERSQLVNEVRQLKTQLANLHQPQSYLVRATHRFVCSQPSSTPYRMSFAYLRRSRS